MVLAVSARGVLLRLLRRSFCALHGGRELKWSFSVLILDVALGDEEGIRESDFPRPF